MEMFNKYKSPLGYAINDNNTDTYGVDHSGFTTQDEIEYQMARQQRENQMIKNFHNQGITQDYPQAGTNFWGDSPDNNFGFGNSQISSNIENIQNTPVPNVQNQAYGTSAMAGPSSNSSFSNSINPYARIKQLLEQNDYTQNQAQSFEQKVNDRPSNNPLNQIDVINRTPNPRHYSTGEIIWDYVKDFGRDFVSGLETLANKATLGGYNLLEINTEQNNQDFISQKNNLNNTDPVPRYWDTAAEGEKVWNYVQQQEGNVIPNGQRPLGYGTSAILGGIDAAYNYQKLKKSPYTDKYKHALINCKAAQSGLGGYDLANAFSNFKEDRDISSGRNTLDSSQSDQYANKIGRLLGTKYPKGDCDVIVQNYINKHY